MKYTVYRTTNTINGKNYVGVHKERANSHLYLGSGIALRYAFQKYGRHKFTKEILFRYNTIEEAYAKERELVNGEFIKRPDTYNMIVGGIPTTDRTPEHIEKMRILSRTRVRKPVSEETRALISASLKARTRNPASYIKAVATRRAGIGFHSPCKGKKQSIESNAKRSESHLKLVKVECPHCGKRCDPGNAKLWHFDRCKLLRSEPSES